MNNCPPRCKETFPLSAFHYHLRSFTLSLSPSVCHVFQADALHSEASEGTMSRLLRWLKCLTSSEFSAIINIMQHHHAHTQTHTNTNHAWSHPTFACISIYLRIFNYTFSQTCIVGACSLFPRCCCSQTWWKSVQRLMKTELQLIMLFMYYCPRNLQIFMLCCCRASVFSSILSLLHVLTTLSHRKIKIKELAFTVMLYIEKL